MPLNKPLSDQQRIKGEIADRFKISPSSITYSKLSPDGRRWNFDVMEERFASDIYFAFHDQARGEYSVAMILKRSLDISGVRRRGNQVRFVINTEYVDNSGLSFRAYLQ